jgi:NAD-dependent dihydropyrimidine dehydrogenase PreA subunit
MLKGFEQKIKISLDDKACRACQLCVDVCPVEVFSFDDVKKVASVKKESNCIGCMSCYYICPSTCIELEGVPHSKNFYADSHGIEITSKLI